MEVILKESLEVWPNGLLCMKFQMQGVEFRMMTGGTMKTTTTRGQEIVLFMVSRCWLYVLLVRGLCTMFNFFLCLFMLEPRILAWNCRGVGSKAFLRYLSQLLAKYKPCILILLETRVDRFFYQECAY